jgi:diaminopimelate decarboxylase
VHLRRRRQDPREIEYALQQGIYCFNAESEAELRYINQVAGELGKKAPVAVRVNPNVDAKTHAKITTGKSENKFGIDFDQIRDAYAACRRVPEPRDQGPADAHRLAAHQRRSVPRGRAEGRSARETGQGAPRHRVLQHRRRHRHQLQARASTPATRLVGKERRRRIRSPFRPTPRPSCRIWSRSGLRILCEPGRFMVGNAGVLLTKVLYEKRGSAKTFKIVDAGMNDLIRPRCMKAGTRSPR